MDVRTFSCNHSIAALVLIVVCIVLGVMDAGAAAPANDNFDGSTVLPSIESLSVRGTTFDASSEPGDPARTRRTVWYSWTAPSSGAVAVSAVSDDDPLYAYIVVGDQALTTQTIAVGVMTAQPVAFYAIKGQTYRICISDYVPGYISYDGYGFTLGLAIVKPITDKTKYVAPLANDHFDSPLKLTQKKVTFVQYTAGADFEPFELDMLAGAGVRASSSGHGGLWINWTPPISGTAAFSATSITGQDVLLLNGKGRSLPTFSVKKGDANGYTFKVKAGKTYQLYLLSSVDDYQVLASLKVIPTR